MTVVEIAEDVSAMLTCGRENAEKSFNESAAGFARGTQARFSPENGMAQRPLRGIIRRLNAAAAHEGPQRLLISQKISARRLRLRLAARRTCR